MGREMRRVPANWEHPKDEQGHYLPLFDQDYQSAVRKWKEGFAAWERQDSQYFINDRMERWGYSTSTDFAFPFAEYEWWEWEGKLPDPKYYRPAWTEEERTHYQMYETITEGTPISPVMSSIEELAHWLADNKANAFAGRTATYEQWLAACKVGGVLSGVYIPGRGFISGVEAITL